MDASVATVERVERPLEGRSPRSRLADPMFQWVLAGLATLVLLLIAFFFVFLFEKARPALAYQGLFSFIFTNDWNPARNVYGGWPLVFGTLVTSALALVMGVPVAVATAIYINELCPRRLKAPLTALVEA